MRLYNSTDLGRTLLALASPGTSKTPNVPHSLEAPFRAQLLIRPIFAQLAASRPGFAHPARSRSPRTSRPRASFSSPDHRSALTTLRAFLRLRPSKIPSPPSAHRSRAPPAPFLTQPFTCLRAPTPSHARAHSRFAPMNARERALPSSFTPSSHARVQRRTVTRPDPVSHSDARSVDLSSDGAEDRARAERSVGRSVPATGPRDGSRLDGVCPPGDKSRVQSRFDSLAETSSGSTIDRSRPVDGHRPRAKISSRWRVGRSIDRSNRSIRSVVS